MFRWSVVATPHTWPGHTDTQLVCNNITLKGARDIIMKHEAFGKLLRKLHEVLTAAG